MYNCFFRNYNKFIRKFVYCCVGRVVSEGYFGFGRVFVYDIVGVVGGVIVFINGDWGEGV